MVTYKDEGNFDLGVVCDTLLDLLRYQPDKVLDPRVVIEDFRYQKDKNLTYEVGDLVNRIKSKFTGVIVNGLIKIVV